MRAVFIFVSGCWSFPFTVVWFIHCCGNNRSCKFGHETEGCPFLLEKKSDSNRQRTEVTWGQQTDYCKRQKTWANLLIKSFKKSGIPSSFCTEQTPGASVLLGYLFQNSSLLCACSTVLSVIFCPVSVSLSYSTNQCSNNMLIFGNWQWLHFLLSRHIDMPCILRL